MDLRLVNGAVFQVVGPSGSGKTHFVINLLSSQNVFKEPTRNIYWLMGTSEAESCDTQKQFKSLKNVKILKGFEKGWQNKPQKGDVVVIDDLFSESTKEQDFNNMSTKVARHRQVTVIS